MRIELFTSKNCANCKHVKKALMEILKDLGKDYGESVEEKELENSDNLAELLMNNIDSVPALRIGERFFHGEILKDKNELMKLINEAIKQ